MPTVWILGAGASISHSKGVFPSTLGFLQTARNAGMLFDAKNRLKPYFQPLNQYLVSRFKRNLIKGKLDINIEEVLTYLEIDIEREKSAVRLPMNLW